MEFKLKLIPKKFSIKAFFEVLTLWIQKKGYKDHNK
tara:strand:- start:264 stop:371 length:108 start_codon:yes stop_codon:yes gene_type:complete